METTAKELLDFSKPLNVQLFDEIVSCANNPTHPQVLNNTP